MSTLFSISELNCSYGAIKVLAIDSLEIPKNQLLFLLGASGTGKSTLLETLGLMNNTITSGTVLFSPEGNTEINYEDLWKNDHQASIGEIRKRHFSFIFQNTNLMENFTAYENVCLARMIKEEKNQYQVIAGVKNLMERVRLPQHEVNPSTIAKNLSGGQRQRLAFVRALSARSSVLLCDEPTGNLDEANANELFEVIKESMKSGLSGIVVSHDIDLALKHADQIVLITKETSKQYGEILSENVFRRSYWENLSHDETELFKIKIKSTFIPGADHILQEKPKPDHHANFNLGFKSLFFKRESLALAGNGGVNFLILCAIILVTFIAIGFANGSLDYLNQKRQSAFVNWLTINIPYSKSNEGGMVKEIKEDLERDTLKKEFGYSDFSAFKICRLPVCNANKKDYSIEKGRTFDPDNDSKFLKEEFFGKTNFIFGDRKGFTNREDLSIVVTEKLLSDFNYRADADYIYVMYPMADTANNSTIDVAIPVPVKCVVKVLPGKNIFACTEYFWKSWLILGNQNPFDPSRQTSHIKLFVRSDSLNTEKISVALKEYFAKNSEYERYTPKVKRYEPHENSFGNGYDIDISFFPALNSYRSTDSLFGKLISIDDLNPFAEDIQRIYFYNDADETQFSTLNYDVLSVYFSSLNEVRRFSEYVFSRWNEADDPDLIEVDTSQIKDKENYNFLGNITLFVAYLIIFLGSVSVSLFIFNLLKMHLNKVKMNIGTFKAIGLRNHESRNIYFIIISLFVAGSLTAGFMLAFGAGYIVNNLLAPELNVEKDIASYFNILNWNTATAAAIFILFSMIVSWITINKMLSKSPGDLIYNR